MEKLGMTFYGTTEYTKLDGSATFRAETWRRQPVITAFSVINGIVNENIFR